MKSSGIGGQALIEGVMMKNGDEYAVAVRKPDGEISVTTDHYKSFPSRGAFFRIPFIRGIFNFIDSLVLGMRTLNYSASFYDEEDPEAAPKTDEEKKQQEKHDNALMGVTTLVSVVLAVAIFMLLPTWAAGWIRRLLAPQSDSYFLLALIEGIIRIAIFIAYVWGISLMPDIRRVYMYHGAEHKSINCIEHGMPLTVENVRKSSKQHKRCGTSFMLFVVVVSVIVLMFVHVETLWLRFLTRILLLPVICGISYEFLRLAGRSDNPVVNVLSQPGLWLQRLTTREPDDSMIEVGIASVNAVFDWRTYLKENFPDTEIPDSGKADDREEGAKTKAQFTAAAAQS